MAKLRHLIVFVIILLLSACSKPDSQTLTGKSITFSKLKGDWVYINYWADWCKPCTEEIPQLNKFYKKHENSNVKVFAVNFDGVQGQKLKSLINKYKIAYPSLVINPAKALGIGEIPGLPVTYIISPDGKLFKKLYGPQTLASLQKVISTQVA